MNRLICTLTGHTMLDAASTWRELEQSQEPGGCKKLDMPPLPEKTLPDSDQQILVFLFPDGVIRRFQRSVLRDGQTEMVQITAEDITQLYQLCEELRKKNERLEALRQRQKIMIENISQVNQKRELLAAKLRIHDEFGQCLLATKRSADEDPSPEAFSAIAKSWYEALNCLGSIPDEKRSNDDSTEAELMQVADMIGCRIIIKGERPKERSAMLLFYAAVREALSNAVLHAGASHVFAEITKTEDKYRAVISDDGRADITELREGVGLSSLRRRLEEEGASLTVTCDGGVVLHVDIPRERSCLYEQSTDR